MSQCRAPTAREVTDEFHVVLDPPYSMSATRLYHFTTADAVRGIISDGFRDCAGAFATGRAWQGVWLTDDPARVAEDDSAPQPGALLAVDLDVPATTLDRFEWVLGGRNSNRWLVPADWLNRHAERIAASAITHA